MLLSFSGALYGDLSARLGFDLALRRAPLASPPRFTCRSNNVSNTYG
jgi:hypothetical protein